MPVWILTIILLVLGLGQIEVTSVINAFKVFIYPTSFWFVAAIALFYPIIYFFVKIELKYNKIVSRSFDDGNEQISKN